MEKWKEISVGFDQIWQYPHCCGSIDGKHFRIRCPANSSSTFYNYKVRLIGLSIID